MARLHKESRIIALPWCFSSLLAFLRAEWINKLSVSNYNLCLCGTFLSCLPTTQTTSGTVCFFSVFCFCQQLKFCFLQFFPFPPLLFINYKIFAGNLSRSPHDTVQTPSTVNQTYRRRNLRYTGRFNSSSLRQFFFFFFYDTLCARW